MNSPIRLLLVDDHTIFRESLLRLFAEEPDISVVAHCATIAEAQTILSATEVSLILLDYDLGEEPGMDILRHLDLAKSRVRVLMLTGGITPSATLRALDAGVSGAVLKHSGTRQLLEAIRRVAKGEQWWDTALLRSALTRVKDRSEDTVGNTRNLTERQRIVLRCILDGLTNKEIAVQLDISETAVKASIQELFSKAGVRTRGQLVRVAIERYSTQWLQDPR